MKMIQLLRRDERGAAVIEMAIVLPVLILFIYGIFQVGILYQANAGMQHALAKGPVSPCFASRSPAAATSRPIRTSRRR